ncbi:MAG: stage II sporulation protein M [Lactobacillales bacterium]|jgi:uncharacterized membrane protein SpoIIM required for sporulation|nr:stage II sporulation protein M [Lactobacillales bacterium]
MKSRFLNNEIKFQKYIIIHICLFAIGIIVGILASKTEGDIGKVSFFSKPFHVYFFHNILSCLLFILLGFFTYGLLTWLPLMYNAFFLGAAIHLLSYQASIVKIIYLFAHGLFEIPAIFLSIYLGRFLSYSCYHHLKNRILKRKETGRDKKFTTAIILFLTMNAFLFIASIIESIPK